MESGTEPSIRFLACGDTALTVEFGDAIDRSVSARVVALSRSLTKAAIEGIVETVPTFRSLMIHFDPETTGMGEIEERVGALLDDVAESTAPGRLWRLPACYDARVAPDLGDVAERSGLTAAQVVECHSSETYFVYMIGFLPGYPYMGDVPGPLVLPRREDPRTRVPRGSLAIAQTMTAVYTLESPAGWHLIGRCPVPMFTASDEAPALLAPGDLVRFEPVSVDELERIKARVEAGAFRVAPEEAMP